MAGEPLLRSRRAPYIRAMPLPRPLLEEMAARRCQERELAERDRRRDMVRTALACVGWCALGLFCIAWAFHTTDEAYGRVAFLAGIAIGNGGVIATLLSAYRRGERRGDW